MKVNRVILVTNNNPLYYEFWNKLSYTYKEKFGINPTLVFFGKEDEVRSLNLSEEYGEIIVQEMTQPVEPWVYTWALFYFTKNYLNDVCAIMGIDQIPLGTFFLKDTIQNIDDDKYVMLIDDQYKLEGKYPRKWDEGGYSPSAYHIAKGITFSEIYKFEGSFEEEIKKLKNINVNTMWSNKWGMDEAYSSNILMNYKPREKIFDLSKSTDFLRRRVDCHRTMEVPYDINLLNNNHYIECHSVRPYHNHKNYLDNLFNNIPNFTGNE
jgi:hypothetical protein